MEEREKYCNGAVRDKRDGKGRYDLISPFAMERLALVMEKGAKHYADRNWEKGIKITRFLDSAFRHLNQFLEGKRDEDHLGHAMFNIMAIMHTQEMIVNEVLPGELDDMPEYAEKGVMNVDWNQGTTQSVALNTDVFMDIVAREKKKPSYGRCEGCGKTVDTLPHDCRGRGK